MISRMILLLSLIGCVGSVAYAQRPSSPCKQPIPYVGEELTPQLGYKPVSARVVSGQVLDEREVEMPQVCLGLFTEQNHNLVASAVTDEEGRFQFGNIPTGKYRLVVRVSGFYVADIPVRVLTGSRSKSKGSKPIIVYMQLPAVH